MFETENFQRTRCYLNDVLNHFSLYERTSTGLSENLSFISLNDATPETERAVNHFTVEHKHKYDAGAV